MFGKKKAEQKYECPHLWKDHKWYIVHDLVEDENSYGRMRGVLNVKVMEPYTCQLCHKRKDVMLSRISFRIDGDFTIADALKEVKSGHEDKFASILDIEDEINDEQLLNPELLKQFTAAQEVINARTLEIIKDMK